MAVAIASTDDVRDQLREAAALRAGVRVAGRGTWMDAGRPVQAMRVLSTRDLSGILAYVPGDLTLTARAGTTLAEIREATAAHNQWLALDPGGSDDGTLGATVATASSGPLSTAFGTPRDLALGLEFVTGAGAIARGGGRVVKNVAGFDLTRLLTGSWGTLGVITEVTMRLHARPANDVSFAVELDDRADTLERVRRLLRRLPFVPYACEIVNDTLGTALLGTPRDAALFRLGGNADAIAAQRAALQEIGAPREIDADVWRRLRASESEGAFTLRLSRIASEIQQTWNEARALVRDCEGAMLHARPARGVVRMIVPAGERAQGKLMQALAAPTTATRIGERLPAGLWPLLGAAPTRDRLSRRVKQAFDPEGILNPGIFGELA